MVDRCIAVHQYEALSGNVVQGDAGSVCQSVVFRQDCNQPVFCQWKEGMGFTVQHVAAGDDEVIGVVGNPCSRSCSSTSSRKTWMRGWLSAKSFSMAVRWYWDRMGRVPMDSLWPAFP